MPPREGQLAQVTRHSQALRFEGVSRHCHLLEIADDARWTMAAPDTSDVMARPDLLDVVVTALEAASSSPVV